MLAPVSSNRYINPAQLSSKLFKAIQLNLSFVYFLLHPGNVGVNQSTGLNGLTDRYMCRSYGETSFEALLTTLCLWNLHFACGTFIKRQSFAGRFIL